MQAQDHIENLIEKLDFTDEIIREERLKAQARRKERYDKNVTSSDFKPGDLVWKLEKMPGQADKLRYKYGGPYQLLNTRDGVHFKYRRVRDGMTYDTLLHISFAKKAHIDEKRPKPSRKTVRELTGKADEMGLDIDEESSEDYEDGPFSNLRAKGARRDTKETIH